MAPSTKKSYSEKDIPVIKTHSWRLDVFFNAARQLADQDAPGFAQARRLYNASLRMSDSRLLHAKKQKERVAMRTVSETIIAADWIYQEPKSVEDGAAYSISTKNTISRDLQLSLNSQSNSTRRKSRLEDQILGSFDSNKRLKNTIKSPEMTKHGTQDLFPLNTFETSRPKWVDRLDRNDRIESCDSEVSKLFRALMQASTVHIKYYGRLIIQASRQNLSMHIHRPCLRSKQWPARHRNMTIGDRISYAKYFVRSLVERDVGAPDVYTGPGTPSLEPRNGKTDGVDDSEEEYKGPKISLAQLAAFYEGCGNNDAYIPSYMIRRRPDPIHDWGEKRRKKHKLAEQEVKRNKVSFKLHDWWYHRPRLGAYAISWEELPGRGIDCSWGGIFIHWYDDNWHERKDTLASYFRWRLRRRKIRKGKRLSTRESWDYLQLDALDVCSLSQVRLDRVEGWRDDVDLQRSSSDGSNP